MGGRRYCDCEKRQLRRAKSGATRDSAYGKVRFWPRRERETTLFCGKCGKEITDEARFCPNCGHPSAARSPQQSAGSPVTGLQPEGMEPKPRVSAGRSKKPVAIALSCLAACALVAVVCLWAFGAFSADGSLYARVGHGIYDGGELIAQYTFSYDDQGMQKGQMKASPGGFESFSTKSDFDENGMLQEKDLVAYDGSIEARTVYEYDQQGNVARITESYRDEGSSVFDFDEYGNAQRFATYSPDGEMQESKAIAYDFDEQGRVAAMHFGSDSVYAFTYDDEGNIIESANGANTSVYTYEKIDNPSPAAKALNKLKPY